MMLILQEKILYQTSRHQFFDFTLQSHISVVNNPKYLVLAFSNLTQKRGPDEEKSDFEFLAFLVLYYINKACVKLLW